MSETTKEVSRLRAEGQAIRLRMDGYVVLNKREAKELILLLEELAQYPSEHQLEKYDYIKQVEFFKGKLA